LLGCLLPASLFLSWLLLARFDFFYPRWYESLAIDQHIAFYAPKNRQGKADFVLTTLEEHQRLFAEIVTAVHGRSELGEIVYHDSKGRVLGALLRPDEIGHLRDVARLIRIMQRAGWGFLAASLLLALITWRQRLRLPSPGQIVLMAASLLGLAGLTIWLAGFKRVFEFIHHLVFPAGYPWFFYYQDSLMTTLMKAPQLFAAIGATWTVTTLLLYALFYAGLRCWHNDEPGK